MRRKSGRRSVFTTASYLLMKRGGLGGGMFFKRNHQEHQGDQEEEECIRYGRFDVEGGQQRGTNRHPHQAVGQIVNMQAYPPKEPGHGGERT